ncbi:restriction endonuclease subunit S [Vibrio vulnificus]|uniref:restriction endonuclease subunit S n=1 Tax=Vibrio vulnificus TaxID=672 RepID=UPI0040587453
MSSDWKTLTLNEIVDFGNGKARPKTEGNIPIYGGNGVLGYSGDSNYQDETIIIGRVGAYCGATYFENNPIWVSDNALSAKAKKGFIAKYAYYVLKSKNLNQYAQGSSHPLLTQGLLNKLEAYVATNVEVQEKIVSIIGDIEDKIESNRQTNQTLEQIAQALFKSWFVDFDPVKAKMETLAAGGSADDAELAAMRVISAKTLDELNSLKASNPEAFNKLAQNSALFPAAMQDYELGEIPEGWEAGTVGSVTTTKGGYAFKSKHFIESGNPVIKIKNITSSGTVNTLDCQCVDDDVANTASSFKLSNGDLLMAMTGATVGKSGIYVSDGRDAYLNQRVARFESKIDRSAPCWFTYNLVTKDSIFEQIVGAAQGSAQPNISSKGIEQVKAVIPTHDLISKYQELVTPLYAKWISNFKENTQLSELRDTLLPKLLSGEINVTSEVVA